MTSPAVLDSIIEVEGGGARCPQPIRRRLIPGNGVKAPPKPNLHLASKFLSSPRYHRRSGNPPLEALLQSRNSTLTTRFNNGITPLPQTYFDPPHPYAPSLFEAAHPASPRRFDTRRPPLFHFLRREACYSKRTSTIGTSYQSHTKLGGRGVCT